MINHFHNLRKTGYFLRSRSKVASQMLVLNAKNELGSPETVEEFDPLRLRSVW